MGGAGSLLSHLRQPYHTPAPSSCGLHQRLRRVPVDSFRARAAMSADDFTSLDILEELQSRLAAELLPLIKCASLTRGYPEPLTACARRESEPDLDVLPAVQRSRELDKARLICTRALGWLRLTLALLRPTSPPCGRPSAHGAKCRRGSSPSSLPPQCRRAGRVCGQPPRALTPPLHRPSWTRARRPPGCSPPSLAWART